MALKKTFNQEWKNWITTNLNSGQNKDGIFKILMDEGYDIVAIANEMNYFPGIPLGQLENPFDVAAQAKNAQSASTSTSTDPRENLGAQVD